MKIIYLHKFILLLASFQGVTCICFAQSWAVKLFNAGVLIVLAPCFFSCSNQQDKQENHHEAIGLAKVQDLKKAVAVIYNSTDGGNTWMSFDNGIPREATVSSFLVVDDKIFASTDYHGIYSIRQGDNKWKRIDEGLPENIDINAISSMGNTMIMATFSHGIMISKNNGKNWNSPSVQINNTRIRYLHATGDILFAGADDGIYKSHDKGNTWERVWKGVQANGFTDVNNKIYAALMNGAMVSNDNGTHWKHVYEPHTLHDISTDGDQIYAMTLDAGLKKSSSDGKTWENVNNGLGTFNLYTFEVKRFNNKIFAAQWFGIYVSDDWGRNWRLIKDGLPDSTAFTTLETTRSGLIAGIGQRKK